MSLVEAVVSRMVCFARPYGHVETRVHTTQKPLALMEALIRDFTDHGELICDPFAGSGTTGVAALRMGRRFIGWEKDPRYHAIAMKRLSAAREQLELTAMVRP
jgi:site-specific DNA-methyltransferase (adenine-specific)